MTSFAAVPGGEFLMGSEAGQEDERPVHRVHVDAFEASVYPVTRAD
jgi:formylglycine-generating enzyme required for sulfatase activity